jgi:K+-sensing histidine kinase KdpD
LMSSTKRTSSSSAENSFSSAISSAWAFIGYLTVGAVGRSTDGWRHPLVWYLILASILVTTALFQSIPAAAYSGLVASLFFNFFFASSARALSFASAPKIETAASFVALGVVSSAVVRFTRSAAGRPGRRRAEDPLPSAALQWRGEATAQGRKEESRWTR